MYVDRVISRGIIADIIGECLALKRYRKSQIAVPDAVKRPCGAVFVTRSKADLSVAHGLVVTSREAVCDQIGASHWTPNVFRYGTYAARGEQFSVIKGHTEDNLKAITTFVVDVDYPADMRPDYEDFDYDCFTVELGKEGLLEPSLVLETPHGYQAYYLLDAPVWIKRDAAGRLPALAAAKRISHAIREAVAVKNPNTDTGANDFGFFRMPSEDNVVDVDYDARANFAQLLRWSVAQGKAALRKQGATADQVHTPWFEALAHAVVPCARKSGYGRNNVLLTLCLAQYASGRTEEQCLDFADEWVSLQPEPLKFAEVKAIVRSAYSGRYQGASLAYVAMLCERYAPEAKPRSTGHAWVHVAKERSERIYSHTGEWLQDIMQLVRSAKVLVDGYASFTVSSLQTALGISRESLRKVLQLLEQSATFAVKRVRGRAGGIYIATAQMVAAYLREDKNALQRVAAGASLVWSGETAVRVEEIELEIDNPRESPPHGRL